MVNGGGGGGTGGGKVAGGGGGIGEGTSPLCIVLGIVLDDGVLLAEPGGADGGLGGEMGGLWTEPDCVDGEIRGDATVEDG
jgi:hypothetical protein